MPTAYLPISTPAREELLGMSPRAFEAKHGRGAFWKRLAGAKNFYGTLPRNARRPSRCSTRSKHLKPTILTGLPLGSWAAPQKVHWAAEHFPASRSSPAWRGTSTSTCSPGDVLVDDRENHRAAYEAAGVVFIHHKNAEDSLRQLAEIFPSVRSASGLGRGLEVDFLDPLRPEHRLAARPARRGRRAFADRLEQDPAAVRVEVRKRRGSAERRRQPRP